MSEDGLHGGLSNGAMRRLVRRQTHCLLSRLRSIHADSTWLHALAVARYPALPLFFNLRAGAWYSVAAPPSPTPPPTCYFKSTDGHYHTAAFSLTRLNLPLARAAGAAGGALVADVTARGKRFPDSAVTLAVWAAVLNAVLAPHAFAAPPPPLEAYFPPWQPPSVRSACAALAARAARELPAPLRRAIVAALAPHLRAPLRPLYVCQPASGGGEDAWEALPPLLEGALAPPACTPLVFVSASRAVGPLGDAASAQAGWKYLQGAGDDAEGWAGPLGLCPALLQRHAAAILGAATAEECAARVAQAQGQEAAEAAAAAAVAAEVAEAAGAAGGAAAAAEGGSGSASASAGGQGQLRSAALCPQQLQRLLAASCALGDGALGGGARVADARAWAVATAAAAVGAALPAEAGGSAGCEAPGVRLVVLVHPCQQQQQLQQQLQQQQRAGASAVAAAAAAAGGPGASAAGEGEGGEEGEEGEEGAAGPGAEEEEEDPLPPPAQRRGAAAAAPGAAQRAPALPECPLAHYTGSSGAAGSAAQLTLTLPSDKRGQSKLGDAWVSAVLPALARALQESSGGGGGGGGSGGGAEGGAVLLAFTSAEVAPVAAAVGAAVLLLGARGAEGQVEQPPPLDKAAVRTALAIAALCCGTPSVDRRLAKQLNRYFLSTLST